MPRRPELQLPRPPRRGPWLALGISLALHVVVFLAPITAWRPRLAEPGGRTLLVAVPRGAPPAVVDMRYRAGRRGTVPVPGPTAPVARPRPEGPPLVPLGIPDSGPPGPPAAAPGPAGRLRVGPEYGSGVLWTRPLPFSPADLAEGLRRGHVENVDSAVTAIVQAFLDSIAADPASREVRLPRWTTEVAGVTFGLDQQFLYLFGLKIPAAVLALLPISWPEGDLDRARAQQRLMDMRNDIFRAARRAETTAEFRRAIRDIRERKDRERELQRNQREEPTPGDSTR